MASSKRPNAEPNGKGKRQKSSGGFSSLDVSPGSAVFRLLCPVSRIGSVIGKGGAIISQIRQESGVKVKIEEAIPGCDERVITISGSDKEAEEAHAEQVKEVNNDDAGIEGKGDEEERDGGDGDANEEKEDKSSVLVQDSPSEKGNSAIRKAISLVFERMVEGVEETSEGDEESNKSSSLVFRLLILTTQVGCLLGKGGSVIKRMAAESGAHIRILPKDKLPACASASDEIVQISGGVDVVRKALQSVSHQLLENPPRDHELSTNFNGPSHSSGQFPSHSRSFGGQGVPFGAAHDISVFHSAPPLISKFHEAAIHGRTRPMQEMLTFRLLCPVERVGNVIGKGGTIIKTLQQETVSEIKIVESPPDSDDCVIVISGPAHPEDRVSPVQEAVFRVQTRIAKPIPDAKEHTMLARFLVSSNQIGCLLGKGGSIITEMRKKSGAHIRILGKDKVPKCASEDEEVIQVNGEIEAVHDALMQITTRLRHHFFRDSHPSVNYPSNSPFVDQLPPFPPYLGRRGLSPPGMFSDLGPPPYAGFPLDDRPPFLNNIHRPGIPPHISERKLWGPQGVLEGGSRIGLPDFPGGPPRRISGFAGGSQPIITSTTVEVVVPRALVPVIYGEDGECLKQILQISDANITITDPKPGAVETKIIISGTPEQTHAAQSLIQAFVMSERESG
ncbi:KH domain-containing protein HEN4-like [Vigna unguiculata]|uniref:KH domain-containing protein HEN4-like n=1 Tax=Vigna unguiculata TaxID=3917 RepID=UPI0010167A8F|nr:KH domain-containing protein HEN4-like [Vigna unguiculata]XP_027903394.1 KH domain-containing protein HEN4-like [Vigna unguiculata]XP_027903395.1 KH domain-containing protein HEN4-like [Vigna unguiculata]XP_027903396.1 KH domain-containing protein HEN4-like [Vigna unguiculata]XP_027903397.1 KH domain-containing protein HEN4-like [Vigna unguiculata]XP_027903398.1 KH domain-containing protein HEN4-like [Vigna unguiculata]